MFDAERPSFQGPLSRRKALEMGMPIEKERPPVVSLWEQAHQYLATHRQDIEAQNTDPSLGERYGASVVRSKVDLCAANIDDCAESYLARRKAAGREMNPDKMRARLVELVQGRLRAAKEKSVRQLARQLKSLMVRQELRLREEDVRSEIVEARAAVERETAELRRMPLGRQPEDAKDHLLLEEATQEYSLRALEEKIDQGLVTPEALNASILLELDLEDAVEQKVGTVELAKDRVAIEVGSFVERGYINQQEAQLILEYGNRYAARFIKAYEKTAGPQLPQELYEVLRDNARKVAYQTKMDRKTLSGSDHGVRHIYEGNTRFAEQMFASLRGEDHKNLDFKSRDEVLIRQIIIDHDLGYTVPVARAKNSGAAKDHPCVGCKYIEANKGYYEKKFGKHGYEVARDVLLNHSYPSSNYTSERPKPEPGKELTYNRQLIRSVVSTVDSLGVTSETKAMDLFRHPATVDILQNVRLYADAHGGAIDDRALAGFKQDLKAVVDRLVASGELHQARAELFYEAIENKFDASVVQKTFGQYAGVIRDVRLKKGKDEAVVPEVRMDLSRLQALVAETFGDKVSIAGFKKAMEAFGMSAEELKRLGRTVAKLRAETDPKKREKLRKELEFKTDRARFVIGETETTGLPDAREGEYQAILARFDTFHKESVREHMGEVFDRIREAKKPRNIWSVIPLLNDIHNLLNIEDPGEMARLERVTEALKTHINDDDALEVIQQELKTFLSPAERQRLAGKIPTYEI